MQLDAAALKFITKDGWRCLAALEDGMRSHEFVPKAEVARLARLRNQGLHTMLGNLMHLGLVAYERKKAAESYRLTWKGYDYLALHTLMGRGLIDALGPRIGVGKEADVHIVGLAGKTFALKIHRLGRTSFRLSAAREFDYLKALKAAELPVPRGIDHNRHCILMDYVEGVVLNKVRAIDCPQDLISNLFALLVQLAQGGVVHGDFNEFNLMYNHPNRKITMIDFPQVVTVAHPNAAELFERDVKSIRDFFRRRFDFHLEVENCPNFASVVTPEILEDAKRRKQIVQLGNFQELEELLAENKIDDVSLTDEKESSDDGKEGSSGMVTETDSDAAEGSDDD